MQNKFAGLCARDGSGILLRAKDKADSPVPEAGAIKFVLSGKIRDMKKNTGFVAILALGGIVLMYAAMNMDFSQMSVGGLWALAGLGVAMIAGTAQA